MSGERLCVVMPVYNEREAIGAVLSKWSVALDALDVDYVIRPYNDGSRDDSLAVMRDCAKTWSSGDEPYYPVASPESAALLKKYQTELERLNRTFEHSNIRTILQVGGRLGGYRYLDMDQSIAAALHATAAALK